MSRGIISLFVAINGQVICGLDNVKDSKGNCVGYKYKWTYYGPKNSSITTISIIE